MLSDGVDTLQRMHSLALSVAEGSDFEWFTPWKSIDGRTVEPETTGSMKTLIRGPLPQRTAAAQPVSGGHSRNEMVELRTGYLLS